MPLGQVTQNVGEKAPDETDPHAVWFYLVREVAETLKLLRTRWNAFATLVDGGYIAIGAGRIYFGNSATGFPSGAGVPEGSIMMDVNPARAFSIYNLVGGGWNPLI